MKKVFGSILTVFIFTCAYTQPLAKAAINAFIITRMAEKFHVQPKPVNDAFSGYVFEGVLKQLDEDKIFFTAGDIRDFDASRLHLDEEILQRKSIFLQLLASRYESRLREADTLIAGICKQPFNFLLTEKLSPAEDTAYPANAAAMRSKLGKLLKESALNALMEQKDLSVLTPAQQKKYTDSVEPVLRHKAQALFQRTISATLQSPGGVPQRVGDEYCKAIALCYDPHTEYFPASEKEDFDSELGADKLVFGFGLKEDEEEGVQIRDLRPGSPAFKSGQLNAGDKMISVQWAGRQPIDVSSAGIEEVSDILSESNHEEAIITVKKADGTLRQVKLAKEKMEMDDDESKVKSFVLKGAKTIGYISLPAFYTDWQEGSDEKGCANDVAKEIIKLKKENIDGLIVDIRYNGGGSMQEAVALSGIFIDAGPVEMIKDKGAKVATLKDVNRGTIYDGPLLLMINGYSASASEMVAGTLQDYNRAVIMGSPSYGKATAQVVLPLDTTIALDKNSQNIHTDSYIKMTVSQLYRVSGKTAQATGVQPDILLPDVLEADPKRESDNPFALQPVIIEANKYYQPLTSLPITALQAEARREVQASPYFAKLSAYISKMKAERAATDVSLKLSDALQKQEAEKGDTLSQNTSTAASFTIDNNAFEKQRLEEDAKLAEMNTAWKAFLQKDAYLKIAYNLLAMMAK